MTGDYTLFLFVAAAFALLWFMSSRSRKQQRAAMEFRDNLQAGDEVMTSSGMYGTVTDVEGDVITLESTPGSSTRWLRAAIARKVEPVVVDDATDDEVGPKDADVGDVQVPDDLSSLPPEPPAAPRDDEPGSKPQDPGTK